MKKKLKINKDNILVFGLLIVAITGITSIFNFAITDELWNFSNIYKMSNGFEIYRDLNVIITPLFFYVGEILFKLFGNNYFVFRIYNAIIYIMLYYLMYKIFIILEVNKKTAKAYLIIYIILTISLSGQGANYNNMAFAIVLYGIFLYIKYKDKRLMSNIIQGIILFLVFMTKQNMAVLYVLGLMGAKLTMVLENKKMFRTKFLDLAYIAMEFICYLLLYVLYLLVNNNLYNAINFTILGINEFKSNIVVDILWAWWLIIVLIIIIPIYLINTKKVQISKNVKDNVKILVSFELPMLLIMYPIINQYHVMLAITIVMITVFYTLEKLFIGELFSEINCGKVIRILFISAIIIFSSSLIITYILKPKKCEYNCPYYGSNINQEQVDSINKVCEYINKNNAIVISPQADLYLNILNKSNGTFDLPFRGNLGKEGQQGLIDRIEQENLQIILIDNEKEYKLYYQNSDDVREYIKNNYRYTGEIEKLLIYEK